MLRTVGNSGDGVNFAELTELYDGFCVMIVFNPSQNKKAGLACLLLERLLYILDQYFMCVYPDSPFERR